MRGDSHCTKDSAAVSALILMLVSGGGHALDAPSQQSAPPAQEQQLPASITPSDQRAFYETLQHSAHTRTMRGLKIPDAAVDLLAAGAPADAVASLSALAAKGDQDANVALVRIQHWCNRVGSSRPTDPQAQLAKLTDVLTGERAAKAAGVIHAENNFQQRARISCGNAQFDYGGIEARLRESAASGHPASAVELAQFVRDPAQREALLQAAIDKGYAPAMYAVATRLLMAVQRGQTTENVSSIRLLLKQAGPTLPKAKLDLANCMALGCDGHPADALTARAFGLDAARDGEPTAFLSMARMPWGRRFTRTQLLAWQYFGERLNEAGCSGEAYVPTAATFAQTIQMLEKGQKPDVLEAAQKQAEDLWRANGERAMGEQGCG